MKRNPNDPIPGFEEYTGTVNNEKKFHKTHFQGVVSNPVHPKDDPDWEYVGVGRWKLRRKNDSSATPKHCTSNDSN